LQFPQFIVPSLKINQYLSPTLSHIEMRKLSFAIVFVLGCHALFSQGAWDPRSNYGGSARYAATGFSIGTKGYVGTGLDGAYWVKDFWEWDQGSNTWTQKADFGGTARNFATGFSIGTKGYIGTGEDGTYDKDFWEYDPSLNTWTRKADFGGVARNSATGFSIGTKGYIGTGWNGTGNGLQDFWEWDQGTNTWTQKANFGGSARANAVGFSIGTKGYIGTGSDSADRNDFWEWDQGTNTWTAKANFGGIARNGAAGFSIGTKGYLGAGGTGIGTTYHDFWEWDQSSNIWTLKATYPGLGQYIPVGFSIGTYGYIGTGSDSSNISSVHKDFWEFNPNTSAGIQEIKGQLLFSIYPNPSTGRFALSGFESKVKITIINSLGEQVLDTYYQDKSLLDLTNQPNGLYFIVVENEKGKGSGSLVINK
jgi:hypothetical protein